MSEVPSTALDTAGAMLWMLLEPVEASLNIYNPWIVAILALALSFIPLPRRFTFLKILTAAFVAGLVEALGPLSAQLSPVWPDLSQTETYISFGLWMGEAAIIVTAIHLAVDAIKGFGAFKLKARKALTPLMPTQVGLAFQSSNDAPPANLNFTRRVAGSMSLAFTQTLSVPYSPGTPKA